MRDAAGIASAAGIAALVFIWALRVERRGQRLPALALLLGLLVLEAALYENQSKIPSGLFHPGIGADPLPGDQVLETAFSFRLLDVVVPLLVLARLLAGGLPRRVSAGGLAWTAFLLWYAAAAAIGLADGNPSGLVAFEAKAIVYLGAALLALGITTQELERSRALPRLVMAAAPLALALTATDLADVAVDLEAPVIPLAGFGQLAGDAATLFAALGALALVHALVRECGRAASLAAAACLFLPAFVAGQRAALVGLGACIAVLGLAALAARHRVRLTPAEAVLAAGALAAIVLVTTVGHAAVRGTSVRAPLSDEVVETFASGAKQISGEARLNQWRAASDLVLERPSFGYGLGETYRYYDPGVKAPLTTNLTHNIGLDLLLRTGAIGLALFGVAVVWALVAGLGAWRRSASGARAALALAAASILAGLIAKGMFESLFEKYRLAVLLGIAGGLALAPVWSRAVAPRPALASVGRSAAWS
jgi:O-antigen ligase